MAMSPAPVQISFRKANTIKIDFAYSFRPIYYFSRVYGLMPFTITYNARGSINGLEIRLFDLLWFMAILVLNVTITLMISKDSLYLQDLKVLSNILNGGEYFLEIYCMIFNLLLIGMDMWMRTKLIEILRGITTFDDEVRQLYCCHLLEKYRYN